MIDLSRFPRRIYTEYETPIVKADRLSTYLGGPDIYIKRDDLLGLAGGGNKTRKLEFVVADALAKRADTLITCGAIQSNHCRLTLSAAQVEGLDCRLVLQERVPGTYSADASGNNLLYHLLAAKEIRVCPSSADLEQEMRLVAELAATEGYRSYLIPVGASTPIGALGYIACAQEINRQAAQMELNLDHVVCTSGSGGTQAGLIVGLENADRRIQVTGICVSQARAAMETQVHRLVQDTLEYMLAADAIGRDTTVEREAVTCLDDYLGAGYSVLTPDITEAIRLTATMEGILLDPVYTGKAMAGLIDLIRRGYFAKNEKVLFVHTGGTPALYAYGPALYR